QNNTVTVFRCSRPPSASDALQNGQNGNSPGNSLPQAGQAATRRVYDDQLRASRSRLGCKPMADLTGDGGVGVVRLEPVDRMEVTIVVDNFVDLLMAGSDGVRRYAVSDFGDREQLVAEHGFSALVTVD